MSKGLQKVVEMLADAIQRNYDRIENLKERIKKLEGEKIDNENESISDSPEVGVWLGKKFVPVAELKRRVEAARAVGQYGSCWICGEVFTATGYECKHTFDEGE